MPALKDGDIIDRQRSSCCRFVWNVSGKAVNDTRSFTTNPQVAARIEPLGGTGIGKFAGAEKEILAPSALIRPGPIDCVAECALEMDVRVPFATSTRTEGLHGSSDARSAKPQTRHKIHDAAQWAGGARLSHTAPASVHRELLTTRKIVPALLDEGAGKPAPESRRHETVAAASR
jgi:hypothetical protein